MSIIDTLNTLVSQARCEYDTLVVLPTLCDWNTELWGKPYGPYIHEVRPSKQMVGLAEAIRMTRL